MGKNTEIKFVGQPIFRQIVDLLEIIDLRSINKRNDSDTKFYYSDTNSMESLFESKNS